MNLRTFYKIFYKHRIAKASFFLRLYTFIVVPFKYLQNIFFFEKKVNLDEHKIKFPHLGNKNLNILFHKIKNVGHFLHIENPDEFYEVSKNFFKD